jgi:hypothetical protein
VAVKPLPEEKAGEREPGNGAAWNSRLRSTQQTILYNNVLKRSAPLWSQIYLAVALTTLGTLLLELSLTRVFSVVFYYHLAFMAISIALFGLGAGGVFSYVAGAWKGDLYIKLGRLSALNSVLVVVVLTVVLWLTHKPGPWQLALIYFATALPFFISGIILSLVISETVDRVDRVYFFDLAGASVGCLLLIPFLERFGGLGTVISVGVLFAAAAAVWHNMAGSRRVRLACIALSLGLAVFMFLNQTHNFIDVEYAKDQKLPNETFRKWNSFSRIGMVASRDGKGGMIYIDADASTSIASFDFDHLKPVDLDQLLKEGPSLPYRIRPGAKTLVIGPGGGWDVSRALASGSKDVTGVEINPIIATTIMREQFPQLSNRIYFRPEVHIEVEDGRSFVRRSREKYQVIQATLVDTWASTAAGAFALSENNLYTTDALRDYLEHLTDDGVIAFTRWGLEPPRESLRLVVLAATALEEIGEPRPWRHFIVGRSGSTTGWGALDTVIIARKPLDPDDVDHAAVAMADAHLQPVYMPREKIRSPFTELLRSTDPEDFESNYPYDISPVSDNRPFFFYTVQPRDLWNFVMNASRDTADYKVNQAVPLLFAITAVSVIATMVILALPPLVLGTRLPRQPGVSRFLLYFLCIGAGYILIEVALIQKFVLFLGQPAQAFTVVIFSMLVSSGLGSYYSSRVIGGAETKLRRVLVLVAILVAALAMLTSFLLTAAVGLPSAIKIAMTALMIAPAGFLMGMPFPTGLRRLEKWHHPSVRWAWALNAASSVLGSVGALLCAIYVGLLQTLIAGGLLYLAALVTLSKNKTMPPVAEPQPAATR